WKSVANLQNVLPIAPDQLNTYDVLDSDEVVFSVETLNAFIEQNSATETKSPVANETEEA
ncbi:50S ribosomal protein L4, partial [Streptomyces sp. SID10244]|nr:50S ribosomal protein L4 [Streptomyces sp. SID10244]